MRIVSLAPSNTEILYALGVGDQIVAVTNHCDFPPQAMKKPKVGGWARVDDELVKRYKPDLILTSTVVQHNSLDRYKPHGFNVLHVDPRTLDEVFESWITIGKAVGKEKEAKRLVEGAKKEIQRVIGNWKLEIGNSQYRPRLYCEEWHRPPMVSGNWVRDLALLAGFSYPLVDEREISRTVETEEIQRYDPEIIVINICGAGTKVKKSIVMKRPGWEKITAVKTGEVWVIDDSLLNRPGPRLLLGLRLLAHLAAKYQVRASRSSVQVEGAGHL